MSSRFGLISNLINYLLKNRCYCRLKGGNFNKRDKQDSQRGELIIGGSDSNYYKGDLHYVNLTMDANRWKFSMKFHQLFILYTDIKVTNSGCILVLQYSALRFVAIVLLLFQLDLVT